MEVEVVVVVAGVDVVSLEKKLVMLKETREHR